MSNAYSLAGTMCFDGYQFGTDTFVDLRVHWSRLSQEYAPVLVYVEADNSRVPGRPLFERVRLPDAVVRDLEAELECELDEQQLCHADDE